MDIAATAAMAGALIGPYLPGLTAAGKKAAEEIVKKTVDAGWESGAAIWNRLHPKVETSMAAQIAVKDVADDPEDVAARGTLVKRIKEILEADPEFAAEIVTLLPTGAAIGGSKYSVNAPNAKGLIIGDNAKQENTFN